MTRGNYRRAQLTFRLIAVGGIDANKFKRGIKRWENMPSHNLMINVTVF
jgi:hypothetical protein